VLFSTAANVPAGFATGASFGTLAMHEIGHAMGLDHAASLREVMAPSLTNLSPTDLAAGDRAGSRADGRVGRLLRPLSALTAAREASPSGAASAFGGSEVR